METIKTISVKAKQILQIENPRVVLGNADVAKARQYIRDFWPNLTRFHPKDDGSLVGLPKPYLVPSYSANEEFHFNELYYWDSYFMTLGVMDDEHKQLVLGIVEDLCALFKRFKIIPNASRMYLTGRSQPPLLSTFVWEAYESYHLDKKWLTSSMEVVEAEYNTVWMGTQKPNARLIHKGLSRYYDFNYMHDLAEAESGWDMTTRFGRKALNFLPVDLNALLYKYEVDLARYYSLMSNKASEKKWRERAQQRKATMNELMWDKSSGLYYDYNYKKNQRGNIASLAGFYPMWVGMIDERQAYKMVKALKRFERKGGLATTDRPLLPNLLQSTPTQWAYPNGWAPLQWIVISGLLRYDYRQDAERIAQKWLKANLRWFEMHGEFQEKYNVVSPEKPAVDGLYPSQTGFGWTNAVFERLCQEFIDK